MKSANRSRIAESPGAAGPLLGAGQHWRQRSACRDVDPDLFFPPQESAVLVIRRAKAVCAGCPVSADCLDWAVRHPAASEYGVWGGMTERERRPLHRPEPHVPRPVSVIAKYCPSCKTTKDADGFFRNKGRYDGLDSNCKDCRALARKGVAA